MTDVVAHALVWVPVAVTVGVAMDRWAGWVHRSVWHGWLWSVHASHHRPRTGRFEANDVLAAVHAPPAIALILFGCVARAGVLREAAFGLGVGMTGFAAAYVLVHDGLVHGRLPLRALLRFRWIRAVVRAHGLHHRPGSDGTPYSLFFGPREVAHGKATLKQHAAPRSSAPPTIPSGSRG
jgi:beta-carotene 3-hydroxylase